MIEEEMCKGRPDCRWHESSICLGEGCLSAEARVAHCSLAGESIECEMLTSSASCGSEPHCEYDKHAEACKMKGSFSPSLFIVDCYRD